MKCRHDLGILVELDLEIVQIRLLERRRNYSGWKTGLGENYGRMGQAERSGKPASEEVENLFRGEISHDFMKDVNEVPSRFFFLTSALKLGLRFAERRSQRLHLVSIRCVQAQSPL